MRSARIVGLALALGCVLQLLSAEATFPSEMASLRVLVFSRTLGFRHASIPDGITALRDVGQSGGFQVDATEDPTVFNDVNLSSYRVVVFLCTTGDVLDSDQQDAFQRYIRSGGGFVGIHSASDTEHSWPWYGELVGAYFVNHPAIQAAQILVIDHLHPSTRLLPTNWNRTDEWYNFDSNPRSRGVHVLAELNEGSYVGGSMGHDHPIAWCRYYDGGRSFYTAGGHTSESYAEPLFREHLLGGLRFAAELRDCSPVTRTLAPRR